MIVKNVPYYIQVANAIRNELKSGKYPAYSEFPDEMALAARFGVSKDVIRQSRKILCTEGLIRTVKGKGTYVMEQESSSSHEIVHLNIYQSTMHSMPILRTVQDFTLANDFLLSVHATDVFDLEKEKIIINRAIDNGCRIIISSPSLDYGDKDNFDLYKKVVSRGISLILIDRYVKNGDACQIYFDDEISAYNMIRDLGDCDPSGIFIALSKGYRIPDARIKGVFAGKNEFYPSMPAGNIYCPDFKWYEKTTEETAALIVAYLKAHKIMPEVLISQQPIAWEVFKLLRKDKAHKSIKKIVSFANSVYGDDEFKSIHLGYYRIFEDLAKELGKVLKTNFDKEHNGPNLVSPILYRQLSGKEVEKYCFGDILI